jgi:hypothetical protein
MLKEQKCKQVRINRSEKKHWSPNASFLLDRFLRIWNPNHEYVRQRGVHIDEET